MKGGRFKIVANPNTGAPLLEYSSEWDSPEDAAAFFALYPSVLKGKWKHYQISVSRPLLLAGQGDPGYFVCRLSGSVVQSVEGLSDVTAWQKLILAGETVATLH